MHCSDICMHSCHPCSITLVSMPKYSALSCATIDECHMLLAQENSSICVPQEGLTCSPWATCGPRQLWMQPDTKLKTLRLGVGELFCFVFYNSFVIPVPSSQEWTLWMTTSCPDVTKYKPMYIPPFIALNGFSFTMMCGLQPYLPSRDSQIDTRRHRWVLVVKGHDYQ